MKWFGFPCVCVVWLRRKGNQSQHNPDKFSKTDYCSFPSSSTQLDVLRSLCDDSVQSQPLASTLYWDVLQDLLDWVKEATGASISRFIFLGIILLNVPP